MAEEWRQGRRGREGPEGVCILISCEIAADLTLIPLIGSRGLGPLVSIYITAAGSDPFISRCRRCTQPRSAICVHPTYNKVIAQSHFVCVLRKKVNFAWACFEVKHQWLKDGRLRDVPQQARVCLSSTLFSKHVLYRCGSSVCQLQTQFPFISVMWWKVVISGAAFNSAPFI